MGGYICLGNFFPKQLQSLSKTTVNYYQNLLSKSTVKKDETVFYCRFQKLLQYICESKYLIDISYYITVEDIFG